MTSPPSLLGYCTNVHAGTSLVSVLDNLRTHAMGVRERLQAEQLGIGLWFSESAATEILATGQDDRIRREIESMGLVPYTFNGFPQGDFHTSVVKHRVYQPTWWEPSRAQYTRQLIQIMDRLLPAGMRGSISTLPIAWGSPLPSNEQFTQAASQLLEIASELQQLEDRTGRRIVIAIEPEPGCSCTDSVSLRHFFERYLSPPAIPSDAAEMARRYLTVCHDVCHAAVMGEEQSHEFREYHRHGIRIGKIQVSSAIAVPWHRFSASERVEARQQLEQFAEDRYLHQTMVCFPDGRQQLFEDLPLILSDPRLQIGNWRIHFHVPIFIEAWGQLHSTQDEILKLIALWKSGGLGLDPATEIHVEVETYAWGVLPPALRAMSLQEGIAKELQWLRLQWESTEPLSHQKSYQQEG